MRPDNDLDFLGVSNNIPGTNTDDETWFHGEDSRTHIMVPGKT